MPNLIAEQELFFTAFEPKLKNRFIMLMDGIPSYIVSKANRPKLQQEAKPVDHINLQRYVKGKTKWQTVTATLYDPIVPSGAQAVMEWVRLHHESVTGRDGYLEFYKKDITFQVLGPVGDVVEEWIMKGTQITEVEFGEMDWSSDDLANIQLTLQPDYIVLNF